MMDHFITLGDLLKLGSFLLDLTSVILYIYYNQKIVKSITIKRKEITAHASKLWRYSLTFCSGSRPSTGVLSFYFYHTSFSPKCQVDFFPRSFKMRMPQGNAQKICVKL